MLRIKDEIEIFWEIIWGIEKAYNGNFEQLKRKVNNIKILKKSSENHRNRNYQEQTEVPGSG